jgi:hypothetical protein
MHRKERINFSQRTLLEARVKVGEKQTNKMTALNDAGFEPRRTFAPGYCERGSTAKRLPNSMRTV